MIGTVWFVNAVNFLDGLDWMTVAQVVPMTLGIAVLQALGAVPATIGLLALALLGATLGFAMFNKHPASIFLGDAGSLPIGLCLAFMLIFVAETNLAAALLLVALHAGRRDADAVSPHGRRRADCRGAPHAFLSARRRSRIERAAGDGAGVPALGCCSRSWRSSPCWPTRWLSICSCLGLGLLATGLTLYALAKGR